MVNMKGWICMTFCYTLCRVRIYVRHSSVKIVDSLDWGLGGVGGKMLRSCGQNPSESAILGDLWMKFDDFGVNCDKIGLFVFFGGLGRFCMWSKSVIHVSDFEKFFTPVRTSFLPPSFFMSPARVRQKDNKEKTEIPDHHIFDFFVNKKAGKKTSEKG